VVQVARCRRCISGLERVLSSSDRCLDARIFYSIEVTRSVVVSANGRFASDLSVARMRNLSGRVEPRSARSPHRRVRRILRD
jgi:hypothetical protein